MKTLRTMACKIQEARLTPKSWVVGPKSNQDSDGEELDGERTTHLKRSSTYYMTSQIAMASRRRSHVLRTMGLSGWAL